MERTTTKILVPQGAPSPPFSPYGCTGDGGNNPKSQAHPYPSAVILCFYFVRWGGTFLTEGVLHNDGEHPLRPNSRASWGMAFGPGTACCPNPLKRGEAASTFQISLGPSACCCNFQLVLGQSRFAFFTNTLLLLIAVCCKHSTFS